MRNHYFTRTAFLALFSLLSFPLLFAANIPVTSGADSGAGSLRAAVMGAAAGDTITFDGVSSVVLSSEIEITSDLVIIGNGMTNTTIDGDGATRIFNITGSPSVRVFSLTLTNGATEMSGGAVQNTGDLYMRNVSFTGNTAAGAAAGMGGGALHNAGTLTLLGCRFSENAANGASGSGGAIIITGGDVDISKTTFAGNTSNRAGGAIEDFMADGDHTLLRCSFSNNSTGSAPGNGGAVHVTGPSNVRVSVCNFTDNFAAREGGALWNGSGRMVISETSITNNEAAGPAADDGGGGVFNNGGTVVMRGLNLITNNTATGTAGSGGGIFNAVGGTLDIANARIEGNSAMRAGGGIEDAARTGDSGVGSVSIVNSSLTSNTTGAAPGNGGGLHVSGAGVVRVERTSVTGNTAAAEGGGLWNGTGSMIVVNSNVDENTASGNDPDQGGGGLYNAGGNLRVIGGSVNGNNANGTAGSGGGILNNDGGNLNVNGTSLANNTANRAGGAIEDNSQSSAFVFLTNLTVDNNTAGDAPGNGGAVHITGPGNMVVNRGTYTNNVASSEGGALWNGSGAMNVLNVTITGNDARGSDATNGGGGIFNAGGRVSVVGGLISENAASGGAGSGGGIHNADGGRLDVNGTSIQDNTANRAGGGIEDASGAASSFSVVGATISGNDTGASPGNGGGIHIGGDGNATVRNTTVTGNQAMEGGGIWNAAGRLDVFGGTIAENTASGADSDQGGGGLFNVGGGSIYVRSGTVIRDNVADGAQGSGGGIQVLAGSKLSIANATISGNIANRAGGGIEDASGGGTTTDVKDTDITDNTVNTNPGNGGGIHLGGDSRIIVDRGNITGNSAGSEGGGLWNNTGLMIVRSVNISGNTALGDEATNGGGGIFNNGGSLNVRNSTLDANTATGTAGSGGGLMSTDGRVTVTGSTFSNNTSNRAGGGVEQIDGVYTSLNNDYIANVTGTAPGNGGAFHVTSPNGATSKFTNDVMSDNSAGNQGGALWNNGNSVMRVTDVAITGNSVTGTSGGGGIYVNGGIALVNRTTVSANTVAAVGSTGGGITNSPNGFLSISNSTISGNLTGGNGGGIANAGNLRVSNATIALNTAASGGGLSQLSGSSSVTSTIISDNLGVLGADFSNDGGSLTSGGFNLIGTDNLVGAFPASGSDVINGDANLAPLANNGGATETHALQCPSDAVNAGSGGSDQTGNGAFGQRDIGAFELQSACSGFAPDDNDISFNATSEVLSAYPNPASGSAVTVNIPVSFEGPTTLRIVDANGQVRAVRTLQTVGAVQLPISDLNSGTYSVQVLNGQQALSTRVMIVR